MTRAGQVGEFGYKHALIWVEAEDRLQLCLSIFATRSVYYASSFCHLRTSRMLKQVSRLLHSQILRTMEHIQAARVLVSFTVQRRAHSWRDACFPRCTSYRTSACQASFKKSHAKTEFNDRGADQAHPLVVIISELLPFVGLKRY